MVTATAVAAPQTLSPTQPAKGRFLVASHSLADPNFSETVVLLLAYESTGAMGVIINRPADVRLASVLRDVEELRDRPDPVYLGGPVAGNLLLVLIRAGRQPESSQAIFEDVYVSGSRAALRKALSKAGKRNRVRGYAGHAGWGPGQLDREIARGDWHVTAADAAMVFDMTASAIWPELIQRFSGEWTRREAPTESDGLEDFSLRPAGLSIFPEARRGEIDVSHAARSTSNGHTLEPPWDRAFHKPRGDLETLEPRLELTAGGTRGCRSDPTTRLPPPDGASSGRSGRPAIPSARLRRV